MKSQLLILTFFTLISLACAQPQVPDTEKPAVKDIEMELVVDDLDVPWAMAFLPDGSMLITERDGRLIRFKEGNRSLIQDVPAVKAGGQGGLLDIELHPDYAENGWIYLSYSSPEGNEKGAHTAIMRAKLEGNRLVDKKVLYKATPNTRAGHHFGSRLAFDKDNHLFFTIGERGERDVNPQDPARDGGKVYRIYDDGRIPESNPFYDTAEHKPAIYSYGHRNPQGLIYNAEFNEIWEHEHGPRGGDELNFIQKGKNYGWPVVSYGINYSGTKFTDLTHKDGMVDPVHYWVPSIAPCGMALVTSDRYPEWKGDLLIGSLSFQYLERLDMNGKKVAGRERLMDGVGRVRAIEQSPDGYLYVAVEAVGIFKLLP